MYRNVIIPICAKYVDMDLSATALVRFTHIMRRAYPSFIYIALTPLVYPRFVAPFFCLPNAALCYLTGHSYSIYGHDPLTPYALFHGGV